MGPLGDWSEGLGGAVIWGRGGAILIIGITESGEGWGFDGEGIEVKARVAGFFENGLGDVLIGPFTEEFAPASGLSERDADQTPATPCEGTERMVFSGKFRVPHDRTPWTIRNQTVAGGRRGAAARRWRRVLRRSHGWYRM
jgi:hypothetical protein